MADGTINDADFAEQDRSEKNKEENEKLMAAIEHFDRDQEAFNESSSKFDDDRKNVDHLEVEETEKKMTGMLKESKTADDVEKHLNQLQLNKRDTWL
ncbi:unnamed protein product [Ilex paraguariensis]|uniref:Uncharacterized protein n=1 Tax=Ilex paraguariensis TaxID=185542 RepID=A0ABC8R7M3_9AQUA